MKRVIIDTDPGIDDAVAIAMALNNRDIDVRLITTVGGNVDINKTSKNAAKLVRLFNTNVPIAKGTYKPLIRDIEDASDVHGDSGMDGFDFPNVDDYIFKEEHAVEAMRKTILNSEEKITIVAIAPLTNIALLLCMYPEVKDNIEEIVIMGGSLNRGNKGVMSEFNIHCDPEAADIVLRSGIKIFMATLDVGIEAPILPNDCDCLRGKSKAADMTLSLFSRYRGGSAKTGFKMYDCHAIAYLLNPEIFKIEHVFCQIELNGTYTKGVTVFDLKNYLKKEPNVYVTTGVDKEGFREFFKRELM